MVIRLDDMQPAGLGAGAGAVWALAVVLSLPESSQFITVVTGAVIGGLFGLAKFIIRRYMRMRHYRKKLRELGVDPDSLLE